MLLMNVKQSIPISKILWTRDIVYILIHTFKTSKYVYPCELNHQNQIFLIATSRNSI